MWHVVYDIKDKVSSEINKLYCISNEVVKFILKHRIRAFCDQAC